MKRPKQLPLFVLEDDTGKVRCPICHSRPAVIWKAQKYTYFVHPSFDICVVEQRLDEIPWRGTDGGQS